MNDISTGHPPATATPPRPAAAARGLLVRAFVRLGVLPFMLVIAVGVFATLSDQFLTVQNLVNLLRQSVYLILVSLGQMLALVTGGFDLSVGAIFIGLVQNGMNLTNVGSYLQMMVLGALLIIAVVADQIRHRLFAPDGH